MPAASPAKQTTPATARARTGPAIDACSLVTKEEVGTAQSATITDTKPSESSAGGALTTTQCYYAASEASKSVSLALIQPGSGPGLQTPTEFWEQSFGKYRSGGPKLAEKKEGEKDEHGRRAEEEQKTPPKKIEGLGTEAYWAGNRFGGALYVLKNDYVVRVSVGGPDNEETKINKSKDIAAKAIAHLQ